MTEISKKPLNSSKQENKMLRCLVVHNRYLIQGGEDIVVQSEIDMLRKNRHSVKLIEADNQSLTSPLAKLKTALNIAHSAESKKMLSHEILNFKPDIVHVHNFFPMLTPSIYDACIEAKVPVIQTLHNFRLICPGALLMRDGNICETCITKSPYNAVLHGCYRNSKIQSIPVARMVSHHRSKNTWKNKVTRFIALSRFSKSKFIEAGFPSEKISIKSNFAEDINNIENSSNLNIQSLHKKDLINGYALYVGRLSAEKGISTLLNAWKDIDTTLKIVGHGPLSSLLNNQQPNVEYIGSLSKHDVLKKMLDAKFLVMPSECFESFPLVIVEAFAQGIPVIASRMGAMAEIIDDGHTGLLFEPGNPTDIKKKVLRMANNPQELKRMGENAKQAYLDKFTAETNYKNLMSIYEEAIGSYKSAPRENKN